MDRTAYRINLGYRESVRTQMLALATRFLTGETGVVETARRLSAYQDVPDKDIESQIDVFIVIDSETDALPLGDARRHWSSDALVREDVKIAEAERRWHNAATEAATALRLLLA